MGLLQLTQIQHVLDEQVVDFIDADDLAGRATDDVRINVLSRALAAFVVMRKWGWDAEAAAASVTDGGKDGGLDLIAVDPDVPRLMLIQSKWSQSGTGSAAKADMMTFAQGVERLLRSDWPYFSDSIRDRATEIEDVILKPAVRIELVFVHSGSHELADEVSAEISPTLADLNEFDDVATFHYLSQADVHSMLLASSGPTIDLEVDVSDWGMIEGPVMAYYGHVSAKDVATWYASYQDSLFASNLRATLPDSSVNDRILETVSADPEHFWYFNNGVTVLCEKIEKAPAGGADRRVGHFRFSGAQVVNGAQTVGTVSRAVNTGAALADNEDARVMIRFIQLEGAYDGFGRDVTRWTNTQNRVGGRDFLALDPEQTRIAHDFLIDGRVYVFRSGEPDPPRESGCGVIEATVALACLQSDVRLAVQAKREVSRLWADIERAPYKQLFNPATSSQRIWRAVLVSRVVDQELTKIQAATSGRERNFLTHLNRLLLWLVAARLGLDSKADDPKEDWEVTLSAVATEVRKVAPLLASEAEQHYPGYPANLAKNASQCEALAAKVLAAA